MKFVLVTFLILYGILLKGQSVGIGIEDPNPNAVLQLVSEDNNQGLLIPKVTTTQRTSNNFTSNLSDTDNGLLIYDSDENAFFYWQNGTWEPLKNSSGLAAGNGISIINNQITNEGDLDPSNEIQNLVFSSGQITLSNDPQGTIIDLSDYDTDASDDFSGDFNDLMNVPAGIADGDDNTQLTDENIADFGYIKDPNDADSSPTNELQDLNLSGNTLTISGSPSSVDLAPFAGTNTDNQTLNLTGTNLTISGGNTIDITSINTDTQLSDSDIAAFGYLKNEIQTVSGGSGISINQTGNDFEVINSQPDQSVTLNNGGNVTISGTYPNFTLAVPDNLDNSPTNENQTVSAGAGILVNQSGEDFEVTNTAPDETITLSDGGNGNVTIGGVYPNLTIDVPDNLDNNPTNEIELPEQDGQAGRFLTTNGTSPSWENNPSQWENGAGIIYNNAPGKLGIGLDDGNGAINIESGEWYSVYARNIYVGTSNPNTAGFRYDGPNIDGSSGTNDYGIYIQGEDKNYLQSELGIGTDNPSEMLDVVGNAEINGNVEITGKFITPPPSGVAGAVPLSDTQTSISNTSISSRVIRVANVSATRPQINSIAAGADGQELIIINIDQSTTAQNSEIIFIDSPLTDTDPGRLHLGSNVTLQKGGILKLLYSADYNAWLLVSKANTTFITN